MHLSPFSEASLKSGYLLLKKGFLSAGIKFQATSGCRGYQHVGAWNLKGRGPLPPTSAIIPQQYTVSTQRLWMPNVKGVEGSFYPIAPFSIRVASPSRGDFGIHFDANIPGSAGCIVIQLQDHWDIFRQAMAELQEQNIQHLPLAVNYQ